MKIKYGEIDFYYDWLLNNLKLSGKNNRMRMKFLEILQNNKQEYEKHRYQLIKENSRLDENGNIIILNVDKNGAGEADIIDREKFYKELMELNLEEFVVEENETNKEMLLTLKKCVEECPIEWQGEDALKYEVVCRLFDNIY